MAGSFPLGLSLRHGRSPLEGGRGYERRDRGPLGSSKDFQDFVWAFGRGYSCLEEEGREGRQHRPDPAGIKFVHVPNLLNGKRCESIGCSVGGQGFAATFRQPSTPAAGKESRML